VEHALSPATPQETAKYSPELVWATAAAIVLCWQMGGAAVGIVQIGRWEGPSSSGLFRDVLRSSPSTNVNVLDKGFGTNNFILNEREGETSYRLSRMEKQPPPPPLPSTPP
jgi:hypothetical protein